MFGLFKKEEPTPFISAVIVAAGAGSRMGGIDKQQIMLGDIPVVVRSIMRYMDCPAVSEIVVVCRREEIAGYYHMVQDFGLDLVSAVVAGGEERQDSVFAGIAACSPDADYFAIHDGARPLIQPDQIGLCIEAAMEHGAAAAGVPVKDTIKVRSPSGFIESTPDRSKLWSIQTPQVFEAKLYRSAMSHATHYRRAYTDDCQLVEQMGRSVYIMEGSYENIKITTPDDVAIAMAILMYREELL